MSIGLKSDPLAYEESGCWRLPVGTTVYLKSDLADHYEGVSVIVRRGTSGKVTGYFTRGSHSYVYIEMINSNGQPSLNTSLEELFWFWQSTHITIHSRFAVLRDNTFPLL
jgi:hypothetical protein